MKKKGEGKISDNSRREEIFQKAGAYFAVFFMAFFIALVSASAFTPVDNSEAATNISATYDGVGYSLSLASYGGGASETEGEVNMNVTGTRDGAMAVEYDRVNVTTNVKQGYKIYLGMSGSEQKMLNTTAVGAGEACEHAATTVSCYFGPTAGTTTNPVALAVNTWGFAIPKRNNPLETAARFSDDYITSSGKISSGANATATTSAAINEASLFAAVPAAGSDVVIASDAATATNKNYYVYYGVNANTGLVAGEYQGTVVYTAIAEASSSPFGEMSITPAYQETITLGQDILLATSLYASDEIYNNLSASNVSIKIGGKDCTYKSKAKSTGNAINITCTTPTTGRWGDYDVIVKVGDYDIIKQEKGYSYRVSWQTIVDNPSPAEPYTLQMFTPKTCAEMPLPTKSTSMNYTGSIADNNYHAMGSYGGDHSHWYDPDHLDGTAMTNPVAEVELKDARDGNSYTVRKLADGNCWMVDNLRLALNTGTPLNSNTSDINYNMDTGYGLDGLAATTPRTISNPLKVNGDVLGTYNTSNDGVISWTPYKNTQVNGASGYGISWGSPYESCTDRNSDGKIVASECTLRSSGGSGITDVTAKYFGPKETTGEEEEKSSVAIHVTNDALSEYARSYDNAGTTLNDGDGLSQYYGTYYNWYAATAGSGTWASSTQWGDTLNSVCPANWQLPDAATSDSKSFQNLLISKYGLVAGRNSATDLNPSRSNDAAQKAPFSIVRSGLYGWTSGSLNNRGADGRYWSRESNSTANAYYLYFFDTYFNPQGTSNEISGFTVRCVAR